MIQLKIVSNYSPSVWKLEKYRRVYSKWFCRYFTFYGEVYTFLNINFNKIYEIKDTTAISPVYKAIKASTIKMSVSLDELIPLSQEYSENTRELANLGTELVSLRDEKIFLEDQLFEIKKNMKNYLIISQK